MVSFNCPRCGRAFSVPDRFAGRASRCACGEAMIVPAQSTAAPPAVATPANPIAGGGLRGRRLAADEAEMRAAFADTFGTIAIESASGLPAERYVLRMRIASLASAARPIGEHRVEVQLTHDYPRVGPKCRMLTPLFHPNVNASSICIGDHWTAGERLADLVVRIAEMIAYQAYNIRSPLNAEAAMWADLNAARLPIDSRDFRRSVRRDDRG